MRNVLTLPFLIGAIVSNAWIASSASAQDGATLPNPKLLMANNQQMPFVPTTPISQIGAKEPIMLPLPPQPLVPKRGVDIISQEEWNALQQKKSAVKTVEKSNESTTPTDNTNTESKTAASPASTGDFIPSGYVEAGGNYHAVSNNFGNWSGQYLKGEVQTDPRNRWNAEMLNQRQFGSSGVYGAIGNTHIFDEDWFSSVTFGSGGSTAVFLPRYRIDAFLNRKWLERRQLITTFGLGANEFPNDYKDKNIFLGATYYFDAPWTIQGGVRYNVSSPGSVDSLSQFIAVSQGRTKDRIITLRYGYGKEAYQIVGPGNVLSEFYSHQGTLELRQWINERWGFNVRGDRYDNPNYNRTGVSLGVFREF
jgi:YaiO family outer membrane protein